MAFPAQQMAKLKVDFESGRNPAALAALCSALRRERRFGEALDFCRRELERSPNSPTATELKIRLLVDLGRYEEALRDIDRAAGGDPPGADLLVARARCETLLRRSEEAEATLQELSETAPMDGRIAALRSELRRICGPGRIHAGAAATTERTEQADTLGGLMDRLRVSLEPFGPARCMSLVDLDSSATVTDGPDAIVVAAEELFTDNAIACDEVECGVLQVLAVELRRLLLVVCRQGRWLGIFAYPVDVDFGKLLRRIQMTMEDAPSDGRPPRETE